MPRCRQFFPLMIALPLYASCCYGQLIQVGPPDPHACEKVKVNPNLVIDSAVDVKGHVEEVSGMAMINARIAVRKYVSEIKQNSFRKAETDGNGNFAVGVLPSGKYRLVIFAPGFKQPRDLQCANGKSCKVNVVLETASTDTFPESVCPPK